MPTRSERTRGSTLVAVVIVVTLACIGIALTVRHSVSKKRHADADHTVAMLREANKTIKQQLGAALLDRVESGQAINAAYVQERIAQIDRSLRVQYPTIAAVYVTTDDVQDITIDMGGHELQPDTKPAKGNPFRLYVGTFAPPTNGPLYNVEIGYRATGASTPAERGAAEFLHGYQTSYQTRLEGQVLGAENLAWGHYAPEYFRDSMGGRVVNRSAVVDFDSWAGVPVYVQAPAYAVAGLGQVTGTGRANIGSYRTGTVFLNASAVATAAGSEVLRYSGQKPLFARKGFAGPAPIRFEEVVTENRGTASALQKIAAKDMRITGRASRAESQDAIAGRASAPGSLTEADVPSALLTADDAEFLNRFLFTEAQMTGQRFSVLAEKGTVEAPGYDIEGRDFWSTGGSRAVTPTLFTPASRASVRVELEVADGPAGVVPRVAKVAVQETGAALNHEEWSITEENVVYLPDQPAFWQKYAEHLEFDASTDPLREPPPSVLSINGSESASDRAAEHVSERRRLADLVTDFCPHNDILLGYQVVTLAGSALQIYHHGAIAWFNLPRQVNVYPSGALVVDVARMGASFPALVPVTGARDEGTRYKGVFVDIRVPNLESADCRTVYRNLLNGAMILKARDHSGGVIDRPLRGDLPAPTEAVLAGRTRLAQYTAKFEEQDVTYVLGTTGRITFDTSININLGTKLGSNGELLQPSALSGEASQLRSDLSAYYGPFTGGVPAAQRAANPATASGPHRAIFASRLRPALACLISAPASGTTADRGADPTVSNDQLLFDPVLGVSAPTGTPRVLVRQSMPHAFPVNAYAHPALRGKFLSTDTVTPVYDGYLLGAEPSDWHTTEARINRELTSFTASYIRSYVGQPGLLYSSGLAARFNSSDPAVAAMANQLLDPGQPNSLIANLGRQEDQSFVRVVFQRYGVVSDYADTYTAHGSYNFRVQFSGNIKEEIWRDCRVNGQLTEKLFRPLQASRVTMPGGAVVNYAFAHCPLPSVVSVSATQSALKENATLAGEPIAAALRTYAFFHPATPGTEEGPASLAAAVAAYLAPGETRSLEEVIQASPKLGAGPETYTTMLLTTGNAALESTLLNRAQELVRDPKYTLQTGPKSWGPVLAMSPFFGAVEYILADSRDDEGWVTEQPRNQKVYGAWSLNEGLRLIQVRVLQYSASNEVVTGGRQELNVAVGPEAAAFTAALDEQALALLDAEMQRRMASPAAIAALVQPCLPTAQEELPPSAMDGQIGGRIKFFAPRSLSDLLPAGKGWDFYYGPGGHERLGARIDPSKRVSQSLRVSVSQKAWTPQYAVEPTGPLIPVRGGLGVDRDRSITAAVYEPNSSQVQEVFNSTTGVGISGNGSSMLSAELEAALVLRAITFKLFSSAAFTDSSAALLTGFDFAGAGTIFTAADSPHPTLTPSIYLQNGTSLATSDVFGWNGSIKTGIGQELPAEVAARLTDGQPNYDLLRPVTCIFGDPLLTSPVWGRLSTVSEVPSAEQTESFGKVRRKL